jgi:hypothetical protein
MLSVATFSLLASTVGASVPQDAAIAPYQLEVREFFRSEGAEPAYWASYSRSDFTREIGVSGLTSFAFDLREIATVLGKEPETQFLVESGTNRLVIEHDRQTQIVGLGSKSSIVDFLNTTVAKIEPWTGGWTQRMVPFDGTVIPGVEAGEITLTCSSEPLDVDGRVCSLVRYSATDNAFKIDDAHVVMSYRGIGIIDPATGVVYHSLFEQQGEVVNADKVSRIQHRIAVTLLDMSLGGEIALLLPQRVVDQVNSYLFAPREDLDPLNPTLGTNEIRPAWSVDLWVAGRVAEMNMAAIGERGTNPLPVTALGSLVLTDQAISFGGTQLIQQRRIELGEDHPDAPPIERIESPLERAYGAAPFGERLTLVGPETTGIRQVQGEDPDEVGALFVLSSAALGATGMTSRLSFATTTSPAVAAAGGTGAWDVITEGQASGGATPYVVGGLVAIGVIAAIIAITDDDGGGGGGGEGPPATPNSVTLTLNEAFVQGCNSGEFVLQVNDSVAGRTWAVQGSGSITVGAGCNAQAGSWMESAQGSSSAGQVLTLRLDLPPHSCIDGSVSVTVNGAPAEFEFFGSPHKGQVSSTCF